MPRYYKDKMYTDIEKSKIGDFLKNKADQDDLQFVLLERAKGKTDKQIQHERISAQFDSFKKMHKSQKKRGL